MKDYLFVLPFLSLIVGGCTDDLLTRSDPNQLSEENFWASENDAVLGLIGAYSALQSAYLFNSDPWGGGALRLDYISDDGYPAWSWMPLSDVARAEFSSTSWGNGESFSAAYGAIVRANRVIERVPGIEGIEPAVADRMVAEARVIRSTAYLQLAMTYGNVPLVTEPLSVRDSQVPKSPRDEVFAFIFQDLTEAVPHLPTSVPSTEWGRLPSGAALGMLGRAYLYHGDYVEAADAAKQVMDLGIHSLFPDYADLFSAENEVNDEVIFPVTFARGPAGEGSDFGGYWGTGFIDYQIPLPNLASAYYCEDGLPIDESPLCNGDPGFESRDPRFAATLVSNGGTWKGAPVTDPEMVFMRKWTEEDHDLDHFSSPQDWYVLRYADVLLMRAEALVRSGSYGESEVIGLIDQVRERAGMPRVEEVEGTGLPQQELLDVIKHERRVELAFEGLRYFDIKRWDEIDQAYQHYNQAELNQYGPSMTPRQWDSRYACWPLPQGELDANENLTQNNGC